MLLEETFDFKFSILLVKLNCFFYQGMFKLQDVAATFILKFFLFPSPGPRLDFDPDIVAALDDDFDFDNPENVLEDDFVLQANKLKEGYVHTLWNCFCQKLIVMLLFVISRVVGSKSGFTFQA